MIESLKQLIDQKTHEISARKHKDTTSMKSHLKEKAQAEAHLKELAMRKEKFFSGFEEIKKQVSVTKTPTRSRSPQAKVGATINGILQMSYQKLLSGLFSLEQM